ncbi:MAG TPA: GNAT family N-acetyltransferase [Rhodocyclaceae bacterium]|nr:GNAT family N-acetyltransferase [Rhodocyclaceae bacterium]
MSDTASAQNAAISIVPVSTPDEWIAFHAIRRAVLWEARGRSDYDESHPDDRLPNHYPLLLYTGAIAAGVLRLDILEDRNTAAIRRLAVIPVMQKKGLGTKLIKHAEVLAADRTCVRIIARVARDAQSFWEKNGYAPEPEETPDASQNPLLSKQVTAAR